MAYDVKLSTGKQVEILDGTDIANVYAPNITSFSPIVTEILNPGYGTIPGLSSKSNLPTQPATVYGPQYYVRMHLNNGTHEDIKLGGLASQVTWTNNIAGYTAAVAAITAHAAA